MRNKFFLLCILLILLVAFSIFKHSAFAQTSDLGSDIVVECVTFTPSGGFGRLPNAVEGGTFTGTCSAKTKCDIVTCLPGAGCVPNTGFVRLSSGNNFFSPGEINETGQLVNVVDHTGYYLYAAHTPEPLGKGVDEENTTQQLGQAKLVFPAGAENCTEIYWDPYGRIFDAVSLEPLGAGEATVTLLDENGNPSLNTFANNVLIDQMGKYNILINKDGNYKLNVTPKTNHLFTASVPDARYKDLYDFIYKLGDPAFAEIVESPKRVDVALKPIGTPYSRSPDYISREYIDVWFEGESFTKIALRTVHPRTIVKVMVGGVQLTEDGAGRLLPKTSDKEGYWLALIKKEVLSQEGFSIELIKNPQYYPLAKNNIINKLFSLLVKKVSAQQSIRIDSDPKKVTMIKFEPILDYIEGYAYDSANKIIPKVKVNVRLQMNKKVYFSTVADDTGFFAIYPRNLPPYEYYLEFVNPESQKIITQTTGEFVEKNSSYLKSEKIDLIKITKNGQPIINASTGELNPIDKNYQGGKLTPTPPTQAKTIFKKEFFITLLIILLLVGVTVGMVLYIKKSKSI